MPKLVLLPGMHGTGELFRDFAAALPPELPAQVVEYPNDVFLTYAELEKLVRSRVPDEPYVIVAESYSSVVAILFAATRPVGLKGLVLSAGFATSPMRGWLRRVCLCLLPVMPRLPIPKMAAGYLFQSKPPNDLQLRVQDAVASASPLVLKERARAALTCNALEELRDIRVPVLFLQARHDRLVDAVCLDEIQRAKPDVEAMVLDSSHMLLQQLPRRTAEIVTNFVRRL